MIDLVHLHTDDENDLNKTIASFDRVIKDSSKKIPETKKETIPKIKKTIKK